MPALDAFSFGVTTLLFPRSWEEKLKDAVLPCQLKREDCVLLQLFGWLTREQVAAS